MAQTTTGANQAAPAVTAADSGDQLQEVVVTAERRQQDLQKTPVAVTALQGSDLQQQGRFSTQAILEDVPSVVVTTPTSPATASPNDTPAASIVIRGVLTNGNVAGDVASTSVTPAAAYYVDGVLNGIGGDYDINQVQVLRGPQGTLYGRSATSGAVLVTTGSPTPGQLSGNASVEIGNYDLRHYSGALNLGIGDTLALRVSGNGYQQNGFYAPQGGAIDTDQGRVKLLFKPNSNFSALFGFALQDNWEATGQFTGSITSAASDGVAYTTPAPINHGYDETRQYWAQFDYNFGPATLTYIPALRDYLQHAVSTTVLAGGANINGALHVQSDPYHTEELRLTSNSTMPLQWQTGLFYYHNKLDLTSSATVILPPIFPPPGFALYDTAPETRLTENVGLFAESTYSFPSDMRLTTGLRGDYTKVQLNEHSCSGPLAVPLTCLDINGAEGTRIWHNLTFKARLEKDVTPRNMLYGSVSTAFLPGSVAVTTGANGLLAPAPYEPETLTAIEVGSKNRFAENRLQLNGDVYYYRWGGHQAAVTIGHLGGPTGPTLSATQDSPARMIGSELELLYRLTPNDRFGLSASYTDAYYVDKPAAFAAGIANSHFSAVPPWQVNPNYQHIFSLPRDQTLTFYAEALFRSSVLSSDITQPLVNYGSWVTDGNVLQENFTLTYGFLPQASLSAYVRNASNQVYKVGNTGISSTVISQNGGGLSAPRTYGAVLTVHF